MKRIFFLFIAVSAMTFTHAQDITDGLRYATDATNGTARFNALSGAFGALGGDMSSIGINPAGSAVFIKNSATASFSIYDRENDASYFNTLSRSIDTDVNLNQAGGVFVFNNTNESSSLKKFSIGINYENNRNYEDQIVIAGTGNTSVAEFFLAQAQGIPLSLLSLNGTSISDRYAYLGSTQGTSVQNAFLGYQGFIFDPVDPDNAANSQYVSNIAAGNFNHEYIYLTTGFSGKYTLNFAAQVSNNFFLGINLNSHTIDYFRTTNLFEANSNFGSSVSEVEFRNNLSTTGAGFSAQIGAIAKITESFRVGLSLDTPTWYEISEETTQSLKTLRTEDGASIREIVDPRVINFYENYNLQTPGKISASAAYIFGKQGLISFDYSYRDYSNIEFHPNDDPVFISENANIDNLLKGAGSYKLGLEYRISQLSLRGGLRYEESPYEDDITVGDLKGFSAGLGYNFGNYNFDVSYSRAQQDSRQQLYSVGLTDAAEIDTVYNNIVFTLGINL